MNSNYTPPNVLINTATTASPSSANALNLNHNDTINKQVPLKTYFLNKYEQLKVTGFSCLFFLALRAALSSSFEPEKKKEMHTSIHSLIHL
jgi:hypothetical protein